MAGGGKKVEESAEPEGKEGLTANYGGLITGWLVPGLVGGGLVTVVRRLASTGMAIATNEMASKISMEKLRRDVMTR
jgi:hypothetical protein